eukprot:g20948.t1
MSGQERSRRVQRFTVCTKLCPAAPGTPALVRSVSRLRTAAMPGPGPPPPAARHVSRMDITLAPCLPPNPWGPAPARATPSGPAATAHSVGGKEEAGGVSELPAPVGQPPVPGPARRVSSLLVTPASGRPAPVPTLSHPQPGGSQSASSPRALEVVPAAAAPSSPGFSRTQLVLRGSPEPRPDPWHGAPSGCTLNCVFQPSPAALCRPVLSISLSPVHASCSRTSRLRAQGPLETRSSCPSHAFVALPEDEPEAANPRAQCTCCGQERRWTTDGDPLDIHRHPACTEANSPSPSVLQLTSGRSVSFLLK